MVDTFRTNDTHDALVTLVATISVLQGCRKGVPESLGTTVSAFVATGGFIPNDRMTSLAEDNIRFLVTFGFKVAGAEANAEAKLNTCIDEFRRIWRNDRRSANLGGTVAGWSIESLADAPEYRPFAGIEYRLYPVLVTAKQRETF